MNSGDPGAFDALVAPDAVGHDPASGQRPGSEGYCGLAGELRSALADSYLDMQHMPADEGTVAYARTVAGMHESKHVVQLAPGHAVMLPPLPARRLKDGLPAGRRDSRDRLCVLAQRGLAVQL